MGASRKLQGEIDRVLKKVQEGVDVFDSIWNKVYDTDNANQKEKFEADLKKEIKKLQRYRDQIKTWIQSSEIKDKKVSASYEQALMDARKVIEREMERFKICEKETKTKAFSKEGLGQQPKTDPKEKAKSETRDWLNNVVGELENQIDSFEAELEGLTVKKGKTRPPRLTHLETSIVRHKAHIMKLELILRLLDNDELSTDEVNDVKDFLDDYVERNQEDFDEFADVDEFYSSLPLDKVESLEDLVSIAPPGLVKGVSAAAVSLKTSIATSPVQVSATITSSVEQGGSAQEQVEETASRETASDTVARTPPPKATVASSSVPTTPSSAAIALSPKNVSNATKDEEIMGFPDRKSSPALSESGLRGVGRGGLPSQPAVSILLGSSTNGAMDVIPSSTEVAKNNILGSDERLGSVGMGQPLVSPLANRNILTQATKSSDGMGSTDSGNVGESNVMAGRVFSPSVVPGMQWRAGSSFQNQNELGQFRGRTEIAPDQREKFLQRYQQVQQGGQINILSMPMLSSGNQKQFSAQQNPLLTQFNSQSSTVSPQHGLGVVAQAVGVNSVPSSASLQQHAGVIHQPSNQPNLTSTASRDSDMSHSKVEELQQQQALPEDLVASAPSPGPGKNEDDLKANALETPGGVASPLAEQPQLPRDTDLSPGQPLQLNQPSGSLGVIGRRSVADLGAIGDNLSSSPSNSGGMYDQLYSLQMLEAAFHKLPQPKDSERAKSYTPKHPVVCPPSYPQVQAPILNNPAFWERLGADGYGTDTLFYSFYYQQNTYQQYLAAKELKKQAWRYHRMYNTWFQRHEEPKLTTDDYEQGTYVYFDFHMSNDEHVGGWCQRIKTDFKFEYNYLEDELRT
ncbi:PREDICTED: general negative regulator of transcription subunit 3-like isoform X2 [Ipomoea nil]|uniref:general negative regulator of transcription subunit 3-like isoform X2 n=1 Tax=Ipomoea nil TaxID=35883 RepID=UPI00090115D8|nr:PREDICTED: general negative regulator of transcription subunit 3-like isoform X2 [Ipomoea nil]